MGILGVISRSTGLLDNNHTENFEVKKKRKITLPKRQLIHPTKQKKETGLLEMTQRKEVNKTLSSYRGCEHARFVWVPRYVTDDVVLQKRRIRLVALGG